MKDRISKLFLDVIPSKLMIGIIVNRVSFRSGRHLD